MAEIILHTILVIAGLLTGGGVGYGVAKLRDHDAKLDIAARVLNDHEKRLP
jgi:hypothetical protein